MAIEKKYQKQGYGSSILKFTEKFAIKNNYKKIIIIARLSAINRCFIYLQNIIYPKDT